MATKESNASSTENNDRLMNPPNPENSTSNNGGQVANTGQRPQGLLPHMFERCSKKWWNPQMDSKVLEKQCLDFTFEQRRRYFELSLIFIITSCICWMIFFGVRQQPTGWVAGIIWAAVFTGLCVLVFIITELTRWFKEFSAYIAVAVVAVLIVTVALAGFFSTDIMTGVGSFFLAAETIIVIYAIMPLPLHISFVLGLALSIFYEVVYHVKNPSSAGSVIAHVLLHICLHILGVQLKLNLEIRRRSTFFKVGQLITSNISAEFKKVMIDSIMPKTISEILLDGQNLFKTNQGSTFRPLYVERMENVSILYADIVGFTKMSANKTAAELVYLLNDLFRRFDTLCLRTGCEKISTLGDCYYCVSGCPDPKKDHARCCVEMGLGMISAIKEFCYENNVNVDMRIGIHTGIVICGIVGMKRFKFDVWSNDVSFANQMEQWGVPGRIHISDATKACLDELGQEYVIEDGKPQERVPKEVLEKKKFQTYLISKRIAGDSDTSSMSGESTSSQDGDENDQIDGVEVNIENERVRTKSNGRKSEKANDKTKTGDEAASQDKLAVTGEVTHENPSAEKGSSRTYGHETNQPTDPLLSVKQRTSTHRHRSTRKKSRRNIGQEPKIKQDKIFELIGMHGIMPFLDSTVREKQDIEFINSIKGNKRMRDIHDSSLLEPVTMRFKDGSVETSYRNNYLSELRKAETVKSFVGARYSFFIDLVVNFIIFMLVFFASIAILQPNLQNPAWLIVFFCLLVLVICITATYIADLKTIPLQLQRLVLLLSAWAGRHFAGALLLISPAMLVFSHMYCHITPPACASYLLLMGVVLIHCINFNQLNSWMRSLVALFLGLTIILLVYATPCTQAGIQNSGNVTVSANVTASLCNLEQSKYRHEFILDVVLLLLFIFNINYTFEEDHRLTYHSAQEAEKSKNQSVDELLHHIIPPRVTEVIREKKTYSQDHSNVAVVFASITNFNEFYEEQFAGGKECIRILNELIGDVDELLDKKEFCDVEKIKTIGSTFMIAAGLDPNIERDLEHHSHLCMLMDFCQAMQSTIKEFSDNMVYFKFILRIGFNHGSVTAGVIGTTKLLYDIWGDTVNIASRMDSTGMPGRVQVSEGSKACLEYRYEFEHRGSTFVKGKGQMETYLLKTKDSDANGTGAEVDNYEEYR